MPLTWDAYDVLEVVVPRAWRLLYCAAAHFCHAFIIIPSFGFHSCRIAPCHSFFSLHILSSLNFSSFSFSFSFSSKNLFRTIRAQFKPLSLWHAFLYAFCIVDCGQAGSLSLLSHCYLSTHLLSLNATSILPPFATPTLLSCSPLSSQLFYLLLPLHFYVCLLHVFLLSSSYVVHLSILSTLCIISVLSPIFFIFVPL